MTEKRKPGLLPMPTNAGALRQLMAEHSLTYANVAALTGRSVKTVERWLASEDTVSFAPMPDHALQFLRLAIDAMPKKKGRQAAKKGSK